MKNELIHICVAPFLPFISCNVIEESDKQVEMEDTKVMKVEEQAILLLEEINE